MHKKNFYVHFNEVVNVSYKPKNFYRGIFFILQKKFFVLKFILEGDFVRIYLDNCCYNRLHDKTISEEIINDKNAVINIQKKIIKKNLELATSFMLHYENYRNKNADDRDKNDFFMKSYRNIYIGVEFVDDLKILVENVLESGIKIKDAYHIASAILAECDFFITVDKRLLKYSSEKLKIINPVDFLKILEE